MHSWVPVMCSFRENALNLSRPAIAVHSGKLSITICHVWVYSGASCVRIILGFSRRSLFGFLYAKSRHEFAQLVSPHISERSTQGFECGWSCGFGSSESGSHMPNLTQHGQYEAQIMHARSQICTHCLWARREAILSE